MAALGHSQGIISRSRHSTLARHRLVQLGGLLVLLLVLLEVAAERAGATFLLIGYACNAALSVALSAAGTQLAALGLEDSLELVQSLCRFMERNSLPVLAARAIRPQLEALIDFIGSGRLALPNGLEQLGERLSSIVQLTEEFDLEF